jgi:hypothetical protein
VRAKVDDVSGKEFSVTFADTSTLAPVPGRRQRENETVTLNPINRNDPCNSLRSSEASQKQFRDSVCLAAGSKRQLAERLQAALRRHANLTFCSLPTKLRVPYVCVRHSPHSQG